MVNRPFDRHAALHQARAPGLEVLVVMHAHREVQVHAPLLLEAEIVAGQVVDLEEGEVIGHVRIVTANVEKNVHVMHRLPGGRVPVDLQRLRQRKAEHTLVEVAGLLRVAAAVGGVMQAKHLGLGGITGSSAHGLSPY